MLQQHYKGDQHGIYECVRAYEAAFGYIFDLANEEDNLNENWHANLLCQCVVHMGAKIGTSAFCHLFLVTLRGLQTCPYIHNM